MVQKDLGQIVNDLVRLGPSKQAIIEQDESGLYRIKIQDKPRTNYPSIQVQMIPSNRDYGIIQIPREHTSFFPGYKQQFILETDVKPFVMHLTGAADGTANGDEAGSYLCHPRAKEVHPRFFDRCPDANHSTQGTFKRFYDAHPNLAEGAITMSRLTNELYRLNV